MCRSTRAGVLESHCVHCAVVPIYVPSHSVADDGKTTSLAISNLVDGMPMRMLHLSRPTVCMATDGLRLPSSCLAGARRVVGSHTEGVLMREQPPDRSSQHVVHSVVVQYHNVVSPSCFPQLLPIQLSPAFIYHQHSSTPTHPGRTMRSKTDGLHCAARTPLLQMITQTPAP